MLTQPWRIHLFGGLRAQNGNLVVTRFKTQKIAGLLAYLAYHRTQIHSRDVLMDLFWPESAPEAGRGSLSVALSSLRNQFEPPGTPANAVLRADRFSISLNPQAVLTDVADFEAALQAAAKAASAAERVPQWELAVALYHGRLLSGLYDAWIVPEEERLAGLFFDAVSALIGHLEEAGRAAEALRYARQAVSVDPLREEACGHLMRLLAATGQKGAALRQYRELERRLEESLQARPSGALRALAAKIEQEAGAAASEPAAPAREHAETAPQAPRADGPPDRPAVAAQPATRTFLLTGLEESTPLGEPHGEPFPSALAVHHAALRETFARYGGQVVSETGDSFVVAFAGARQALACAAAGQQALAEAAWPAETGPLRARMAVHTGDVELEGSDYHGLALHRATRILAAAHGRQVLVSEATAALAMGHSDEELRLRDLGIWRLRDLAAPQRLYQLEYPGMQEAAFPAPATAGGYQASLPVAHTRFFGREAEIARLAEMLSSPQIISPAHRTFGFIEPSGSPAQLVTLTGPGGTGKSRLALATAERLLEAFAGAVWFVPLADLSDPGLIAGAILDAMRLTRSPQRKPLEQIVEALSRQSSLLILDNFEHLLAEPASSPQQEQAPIENQPSAIDNFKGGASLVHTLLSQVPTLMILVTSRQRLGLPAEREFPVPPLPTPTHQDTQTPEQLSLYDSVRLFVDRAQAVLPYFQVSNANAPSVAELCQRLEGLPLAIELAAARVQVMTPQQMLAQLENRFAFLTSRQRGVEERHRTLRAAVEWSFRLLTPELQRFFMRLSVFRGGWTVEAAEQVCEAPLALDYLAELRDSSLVLSEENEQGMRFRMLETLRDYAQERLNDAAEETACRKRHASLFLHLAEQAEPKLSESEQAMWLERLETEHDNLRAALEWYQIAEDGVENALRMAGALGPFWEVRGYLAVERTLLNEILSREGAQARTQVRVTALNAAGKLAYRQGDYATACFLLEEGLNIAREIDYRRGIAYSLADLGIVAYLQGNYQTAQARYEECLAIRKELGHKSGIAGAFNGLGMVAYGQSNYEAARMFYEESLTLQRELGNKRGMSSALNNLGLLAKDQGDYESAKAFYEESLAIKQELGDEHGIAQSLNHLGNVANTQGNTHAAKTFYEESLAVRRELGDKQGMADVFNNLALLAMDQGDYEIAKALLEESLAILHEIDDKPGISACRYNLGIVAYDQGNYQAAKKFYEESLTLQRDLKDKRGIAFSLEAFARLAAVGDQPERTAWLFGAAEILRQTIGTPLPPNEREEYERNLTAAREALSESEFAVAWEAGCAMSWEQAVAYALEESAD